MLVSTLQYKFPIIDLLGHIRVAPLHIHSTEREFKLIEMISISRSTRVKLHACMHVYACMHAFTHSFTQTVFDNLFFIITTQTYPAFLLNEDMKTNRIVCLLLLVNGGYSRHKKDKKLLEIRNICHRESNVVPFK